MGGGFSLGRIAGVAIRLNWSLLVIFWLIVLSLAMVVFPQSVPSQPAWSDWLLALIATVLFYVSLLAHELAHAIVARRRGVAVEGITLWLFGGVAQLHGEVATPGDEVRITGIGPLVTGALALVFAAIAVGLTSLGVGEALVLVPVWLALMNVLLGVFNLVPALPLDGGRLLHAFLWRRSGDRARATATAARTGRVFGTILIAFGVLEFFIYAALGGLWFVFLGWFIVAASHAEETQTQLGSALSGVRVRDVMSPDPVIAPNWITVDAFLHDYVLTHRVSCFPVHDLDGRVTGLVSMRRLGLVPRSDRTTVRIKDIATPLERVPCTSPDDLVLDLLARLRASDDGRGLVYEGGRLVGIVSPSDVTRAMTLAGVNDQQRAA